MTTFITGAVYYDGQRNSIFIPSFSGEFSIIEVTEYIPFEELERKYTEDFVQDNKYNYIIYKGSKYYYAETAVINDNEDIILLSDISELYFFDGNRKF